MEAHFVANLEYCNKSKTATETQEYLRVLFVHRLKNVRLKSHGKLQDLETADKNSFSTQKYILSRFGVLAGQTFVRSFNNLCFEFKFVRNVA